LRTLLELIGHQVRLASDGPGALEAAADFVPDVALIDIGIPRLNGYDVARRLRQRPEMQHAILIAQTGWGQDEDRQRSREAGFDHHLVKPIDIAFLERILAAAPARTGSA
jgi:two-component system CheB/CheR fusion protein